MKLIRWSMGQLLPRTTDGFEAPPLVPRCGAPQPPLAADGSVGRRLNHLGVLAEHAAGVLRRVRGPAFLAGGELGVVDGDLKGLVGDVEGDRVTVPHEGDRPAVHGLGRDVADAETGGATGEAAVGDQQDVLAETGALDGAGD